MQPKHLPGLTKALSLAGHEHSIGDVVKAVLSGEAQSWADDGAWVITRVVDTPNVRSLHFWLATGDKNAVLRLQPQILDWARSVGCTKATIHGRRGWTRVLEDTGWHPSKLVVLEKEL